MKFSLLNLEELVWKTTALSKIVKEACRCVYNLTVWLLSITNNEF